MPLLHVIVLAVVQGLTEFLPISSTAHLYLTSRVLGWEDGGLTFDIVLHIGTLLAVVIYFFRDWVQILAQGFGIRHGRDEELKHNHMLLWLLAIGTIPVGIAGLLFGKQAETVWRSPFVIGVMLIAVGILMAYAEKIGQRVRDLSSLNLPDALGIGVAQALAVVPGTSRSGVTISAGLFRNLTGKPPRASRSCSPRPPSPSPPPRRCTNCTSTAACTPSSKPTSWWAFPSAP